jgi:hypothetical protein
LLFIEEKWPLVEHFFANSLKKCCDFRQVCHILVRKS